MRNSQGPIEFSYQVAGNLYAGEYPGHWEEETAMKKVEKFRLFGITDFIDLTMDSHLLPYEKYLSQEMSRYSFPIQDRSVPVSFDLMDRIIEKIENLRSADHKVYVHCWGGIGRTGLTVGCWLGRQYHLNGTDALDRLKELWLTCPKSEFVSFSPENDIQRLFVIRYLNHHS